MHNPSTALVCAAVLLVVTSDAGASVAYVESSSGCPTGQLVLRDKQRIPIATFQPLQAGDHIVLTACKDTADEPPKVVIIVDGIRSVIDLNTTPYTVNNGQSGPTLVRNLLRWAGDFFASWQQHDEDTSQAQLLIRGYPSIELPLIGETEAKLSETNESLHLAWLGGAPPFAVRILSEGKEIAHKKNVEARLVDFHNLSFSKQKHEILIVDVENARVTKHFLVVDESEVPQLPGDVLTALTGSGLPNDARVVLRATWLAQHERGQWSLEAYQQISEVPDSYLPGRNLRTILRDTYASEREIWSKHVSLTDGQRE